MAIGFEPFLERSAKTLHGQGKGGDAVGAGDVHGDGASLQIEDGAAHVMREKGEIVLEDFGEIVGADGDAAVGIVVAFPVGNDSGAAGETHAFADFLALSFDFDFDFVTDLVLLNDDIDFGNGGGALTGDSDQEILFLEAG